jgi:hypothetical protein
MRYNYRDNLGRFAKRDVAIIPPSIVAGRLYGYRGTIVRAGQMLLNGKRHISFHKQLHGFVDDRELQLIDKEQVSKYLEKA